MSISYSESGTTKFLKLGSTATIPLGATLYSLNLWVANGVTVTSYTNFHLMFERDTTAHDYEPYLHETRAIPLPLKSDGERWAGGLPDGTADALNVDSAGRWEWVNESDEVVFDGTTHASSGVALYSDVCRAALPISGVTQVGSDETKRLNVLCDKMSRSVLPASNPAASMYNVMLHDAAQGVFITIPSSDASDNSQMNTWLQSNPVTVLYPLATPTTEHGYIDLPDLPEGAVVSCPELDEIGVSWFVVGCEPIVEHISNERRRTEEALSDVYEAIADL